MIFVRIKKSSELRVHFNIWSQWRVFREIVQIRQIDRIVSARINQSLLYPFSVVKVAENTADELTRSDGRDVQLEEEPDLQLPFLLPEDGYSCDIIRGVPNGLAEFLEPLSQSGLCRLTLHGSGSWTVYMINADDEVWEFFFKN